MKSDFSLYTILYLPENVCFFKNISKIVYSSIEMWNSISYIIYFDRL